MSVVNCTTEPKNANLIPELKLSILSRTEIISGEGPRYFHNVN